MRHRVTQVDSFIVVTNVIYALFFLILKKTTGYIMLFIPRMLFTFFRKHLFFKLRFFQNNN